MCAASEVWSAIQPEMVGDNTPPTISPAPTTSPIDDAANVRGTVSDGITPMNTANEPEAVQPISSSRLSSHCAPLKCSAAIGVTRPMNVKMIIAGLRPMRSEMNGTMKPQIIVAMPIGATTCPATSGGMPFTTVKNTGKKMMPTRYHDTMNTEMPQQTRMLRCLSMSNMPGLTAGAAAVASWRLGCGGSLTNSQMSTAQISPGIALK